MIARDEADSLDAAISSVKSIVDEIIFVDTGSKDGTKEIARKFGAKVIDFPWNDDFSAARNESIRHATKEWILFIDADELISAHDLDRINELTAHPTMVGWILDQRNYTDDSTYYGWQTNDGARECRASGFFVSPITRLFRNDGRIKFQNKVHEEVDTAILGFGGEISYAHLPIHHYGYLKGQEVIEAKREKYLQLGLKDIEEQPDSPKGYYEVGKIYKSQGKLDEAQVMLSRAAEMDPLYKLVYTNLGDLYSKMGKDDLALEAYDKAIQLKPYSEVAFINKGLVFVRRSQYVKAADCFEEALKRNPKSAAGHNNLVASLSKGTDVKKTFFAARRAYRETALPKFKQVLHSMHKRYPNELHLAELIAEHKYGAAELFLRDTIHRKPYDSWALSNLAVVLEKMGKKEEAVRVAVEALQTDPPMRKELEAFIERLK